ncbi:MAG: peptidase S10 [Candidatus Glassbacteria bacterium]|nr:peptidase S10 [Candidatus Glassbacteria bacterium]
MAVTTAGLAQDEKGETNNDESKLEETSSVTSGRVTIGGKAVSYTATAGTMLLSEEFGDPKASVFYISYTRDGVQDPARRPLAFCFNGGPGSSSVWLHLGVLGPRRVALEEDGSLPAPPFALVDNQYSLLDRCDLVFIDPVSTGFSRPAPETDKSEFHGVREDIRSVGEFIRRYTTRNNRWASPKFLIGESYGTTRAAGLSEHLQGELGMYLNGIILVSAVLDFQTLRFTLGNDLPYVLFLPSYAATAWYHDALDKSRWSSLSELLDEVETFTEGRYSVALLRGNKLPEDERSEIVRQLARYTGLSEQFIERSELRVSMREFGKELLRERGLTVGRFDSRFTGIDRRMTGSHPDYDASYAAAQGPFTATLNHYVRTELKYESDLPYEILTGRVYPWNYGDWENRYLNFGETLRLAMTRNPYLKVFAANGYYDLATPYYATEYTFSHLGLDKSLRDNVSMGYYEAGHMMYVHMPSLEMLKKDLAEFIKGALYR